MKLAYPVLIAKQQNDYLVYVPDMELYTEGKSPADAIAMARDAIGLKGIDLEDEHIAFPAPSTYEESQQKAKEEADDFDYSSGICTLVDVDFTEYRKKLNHLSIKKNCTIPYWLSVEADKAGLNYSRLLQDAIRRELHEA